MNWRRISEAEPYKTGCLVLLYCKENDRYSLVRWDDVPDADEWYGWRYADTGDPYEDDGIADTHFRVIIGPGEQPDRDAFYLGNTPPESSYEWGIAAAEKVPSEDLAKATDFAEGFYFLTNRRWEESRKAAQPGKGE